MSTLGQQIGFERELDAVIAAARGQRRLDDPVVADRLADAWIGLQVMRLHALRTLRHAGGRLPRAPRRRSPSSTGRTWHQRLGELAMDVARAAARWSPAADELSDAQRLFLFTRADTIYGGSNEIQRNIIADRLLGRVPRS